MWFVYTGIGREIKFKVNIENMYSNSLTQAMLFVFIFRLTAWMYKELNAKVFYLLFIQ